MSERVAVIGAGAIGGVVAAELLAAGAEVTLCARTPLERLSVDRATYPRDFAVDSISDPAQAQRTPFVVVALKTQDTAHAAPWLTALGPSTVVVIQNGVEHGAQIDAPVVPAIINTAVERVAPGRLRHSAGDTLTLAADRPGAREFAQLLEGTAIKPVLEPDFTTAAWRKLFSNLAGNPVTTITERRSEVFHLPAIRDLVEQLLDEALPVARAEGARLSRDDIDRTLDFLTALPLDVGSSMLYDRLNGRPLESDALVGAVIRAGRRHDLPTPRAETLYALLQAITP